MMRRRPDPAAALGRFLRHPDVLIILMLIASSLAGYAIGALGF